MLSSLLKALSLVAGLVTAWCGSDTPAVAPTTLTTPVAKAPVCTPFQDFATDAESKWVCESCRQWYYLDVGLPEGVSFDDCVDNALSRARARREKATPQNKASAR